MATVQACIFLILICISNIKSFLPRSVLLSYLINTSGSSAYKCCGVYQHLDSSARCVDALWPRADVDIDTNETDVVSARDESWTSRWFPPGPARQRLIRRPGVVFHSFLSKKSKELLDFSYFLREYNIKATARRSLSLLDVIGEPDWQKDMVLFGDLLMRPKPDDEIRLARYCVDAIEGPMAPYVVMFRTTITMNNDRFSKCCKLGEVVATKHAGYMDCETDSRAWTDPRNTSVSIYFDAETPFDVISFAINKMREFNVTYWHFHTSPLVPGDALPVKYIRQGSVQFLSSTWWFPCADLKREENGDVTEVFGYFAITRHTRAAYMVSRNLSFASALILLAALVAIGSKERMRSSVHGWALGCHVICLLLYNIGQIVYYQTSHDREDGEPVTYDRVKSCLEFVIPMYFFLTAANTWMTAVSANMYFGFKMTGGARSGGGDRKRFIKLSAFAWSVAAALTGVSVAAFLLIHDTANDEAGGEKMLLWYRPTFAETRTCYSEVGYFYIGNILKRRSQKWGTTLYYYVPTVALVAANCVLLCLTGLKVRYLRRGNSLLKRDEREGGGRTKGGGSQQDKGSTAEPKSVTVYIKLLLAGGVFEFLAEALTWAVSSYQPTTNEQPSGDIQSFVWKTLLELNSLQLKDHSYAHRAVGYWADLFRALVVLLVLVVAPDLRTVWRRLRGKGGDSPAQGAATRLAACLAARPAPRRGQQESAL